MKEHKDISFLIKMISIAFLILIFSRTVIQPAWVTGSSMIPTLPSNSLVLINRLDKDLKRGDLVSVKMNVLGKSRYVAKRVIGFPGESIEIKEGFVYVDGELLIEDYVFYKDGMEDQAVEVVPEDSIYVLGDNRVASFDSRYYGSIPIDDLVGIIFYMFFK